jgi:hypothetical protein
MNNDSTLIRVRSATHSDSLGEATYFTVYINDVEAARGVCNPEDFDVFARALLVGGAAISGIEVSIE